MWLLMQSIGVFTAPEEAGGGVAFMAHLGGFVIGSVLMVGFQQLSGRKIAHRRDGELEIVKAESLAATADNGSTRDGILASLACDYCESPLSDDNQMADNLWRCPNPACGQLHIEVGVG